ncbi:tRNA (adenosine(37)-N6)-threonylcarbamoyltransferase complex dimerization subunit type 1 TsaB [Sciscionella sediminilitoris]|uniref:tRNA (adenosine(37)-N6)-threonylcarbamoyltransferase complex dimerization subunit type 1 TsaB n=1 Tax=Sciscionella sediminilitoris TaxID=1445613 RepID=UPI0004DF8B92|nr:tRNA (adenosine(37)-N6)-threonylcarbamoyltransferase complex dimerization subunit type 1 TsaB [Sciscionella sp. SE31]
MHVLAIDTSTPVVTAGIVELTTDAVRVTATSTVSRTRAHAELLGPEVRELLRRAPAGIAAIVCGVGPGAFTGLRVGMVTAAALGHALEVPVYPVCTLDAIAALAGPGPFLVATDARRKELYWAVYGADGTRVAGPDVGAPDMVRAVAAEHGITRILGDGVLDGEVLACDPLGLVHAAEDAVRANTEPAALTPLYLRRPDAKEPAGRKRVSR